MADPKIERFYAEHCDMAGGVIVVHAADDRVAVFKSPSRAMIWAEAQEKPCVLAPYVLDEPDFGNVPARKRH